MPRARLLTAALAVSAMLLPSTGVLAQQAAEPAPAAPGSAVPGGIAEPDPQALALAREIIRVGYPEDKRSGMFFGAVDAMTSQMRSATMGRFSNDPAAVAIMDRNIARFIVSSKGVINRHIPAFMDAYAKGYAREFSVAELEQLLAFVRTPGGGHFFLRNSAVLADPSFAAANQDYIRELQPLMEQMRQSLTRELVEHFSKNPPKPTTGS